ncbi:MAG: ABC transporter permease [Legionellales bacterium RIFCSPHIGHO2_12_FULL_42_9]|nr:MAG: ABC transporter permease [Legionellales bacterium RIFCSPHIGHO2_12_FULL_42_9]
MTPTTLTDARWILDSETNCYFCEGAWSTLHLNSLTATLNTPNKSYPSAPSISGKHLTQFDSAGALALIHCLDRLKINTDETPLTDFTKEQLDLIALVKTKKNGSKPIEITQNNHGFFYTLGKEAVNKLEQIDGLIVLIGDLADKLFLATTHWRHFRYPSILSNMGSAGVHALPILALLSFLIGVVLAYQMGLQLETYGASVFIAYLSSMAIFREFAPLITAIIVAGRTSSAFTAQIGSMKINEEIDALNTMGLSPTELLVVPKVIALLIMFPLIMFWSDLFSILGAMIMSKFMLGVGYLDFLSRVQETVRFKQLMLGLYKAPAFALLIALVGCFQGFRVEPNADSVGSQTTKSVVQALFLIIVTDAAYSIIYSWLDL